MDHSGPEFGAEEIRSLLDGLSVSNHAARCRAIKRFEVYVSTARPDLYDDDVDVLFRGDFSRQGLIAACGTPSKKHLGRLKRSAANAIALVRFLVHVKIDDSDDNIFLERLIELPMSVLRDLRLDIHLRPDSIEGASSDREGSRTDAVALISLLRERWRPSEGEHRSVVELVLSSHAWSSRALSVLSP